MYIIIIVGKSFFFPATDSKKDSARKRPKNEKTQDAPKVFCIFKVTYKKVRNN